MIKFSLHKDPAHPEACTVSAFVTLEEFLGGPDSGSKSYAIRFFFDKIVDGLAAKYVEEHYQEILAIIPADQIAKAFIDRAAQMVAARLVKAIDKPETRRGNEP
jgi:hypothetical protein